jgi:hypothetical protein
MMIRRKVMAMVLAFSSISSNTSKLIKTAMFLCIPALFVTVCQSFSQSQRGKVIDRFETTNGSFRVQILQYDEQGAFPAPAGAYYLFRSAIDASDSWNEIMTFRHDDPVPIPKDHVRFVDARVGYVFMGWLYAVTTDGSHSWSVWDASKDPIFSKSYRYDLIREVEITPDGNGRMILHLKGDTEAVLKTKDYGQHWAE